MWIITKIHQASHLNSDARIPCQGNCGCLCQKSPSESCAGALRKQSGAARGSWRWCLGRTALAARVADADSAQRWQGGSRRHGAVLSTGTVLYERGNGRQHFAGPDTTNKDEQVGDIVSGWRLPWLLTGVKVFPACGKGREEISSGVLR